MFKFLSVTLLLSAFILSTSFQVKAEEDPIEDEATDDDSKIESEDDTEEEAAEEEEVPTSKEPDEEDEKVDSMQGSIRTSTNIDTSFLFTDYPDKDLPAGKPIYLLVGFHNKGDNPFLVQTVDASFRYPQDYSYHIQNFTGTSYNKVVKPGEEASFQYAFHPHESYGGRPFGLTVLMFYKDITDGIQYGAGVFNETITFKEVDEAFDGETFFLYVLLAAIALLVILGLNYAFNNSKLKRAVTSKHTPEVGTQNGRHDIDYDWIPKETTEFSKPSPRRSPRQRNVKRSTGSGDE